MLNTALAPWPSFTEEEAEAVAGVLLSNRVNYWTGNEGREFEREFASWAGSAYAIALANGTVALDLALRGCGIGAANGGSASDEVVVTPRTFLASVSTVVNAGAVPRFADVDRDSGNICATTIEPLLGPRTKAIVPVHLGGWPCDMDPIMDLARSVGAVCVEDCAQAHGAHYRGRPVGGIGDIGAWSFCQDKIMTTGGEGGMITCQDRELWSRMWSFKDHGKSWEAVYERNHPPGFRWLHESFGTNWRMIEMQAAIGRILLRRMEQSHAARAANAGRLVTALGPFAEDRGPLRLPSLDDRESRHAWYRLYVYVKLENLAADWSRDRIIAEFAAEGVPLFQGSCSEVYLERAFEGTGLRPSRPLPVACELGKTSLAFLVHPTLTQEDLDKTCAAIEKVFSAASRL